MPGFDSIDFEGFRFLLNLSLGFYRHENQAVIIEKLYQTIEGVFIRLPNTYRGEFKKNSASPRFSIHFSVFGYPNETVFPVCVIHLHVISIMLGLLIPCDVVPFALCSSVSRRTVST